MNMGVMISLLIWLVAPFAEMITIVILAVVNSRYKTRIHQLTKELEAQMWRRQDLERKYQEQQMGQEQTQQGQGRQEQGRQEQTQEAQEMQPQEMQPQEMQVQEMQPRQANWVVPAGNEYNEAVSLAADVRDDTRREPAPKPSLRFRMHKPVTGFYQGTAALIIGVVFVVLAGLIFATTAWHVLPSFCKVIMVLGFSGLFFGASRLAGKLFKIERTSQAFYILGSVFLFLTVLAAGYFGLLGTEFILKGENRFCVLFAGSLVTELALFAGLKKFNDRIYTQACLWGMTVTIAFLLGALRLGYAGCVNGMVYYSFLLVLCDHIGRKRQLDEGNGGSPVRPGIIPEILAEGYSFFATLHFWIFSGLIAFHGAMGWMEKFLGRLIPSQFEITFWSALALGLTAAGIALIALRRRTMTLLALHSISVLVFFHYAGLCVPVDFVYQILMGALGAGVWFMAEKRIESPLCNVTGRCLFTAAIAADTGLLLFIGLLSWKSVGEQLAASVLVVLLTAVLAQWSRQYPVIRQSLPLVLSPLTMTVCAALEGMSVTFLTLDRIIWIYVLAVAVWDVVKKDDFCIGVMVISTGAQILFWMAGRLPLPFLMLAALYLLAISFFQEGEDQIWCIKTGCIYSLAGMYIMTGRITDNNVTRMTWVAGAFAVEYGIAYYRNREKARELFWDITGVAVLLAVMGAYYVNTDRSPWNLFPVLTVIAVFYVILYRNGRIWPHLLAALAVLPVPGAAALRYNLTEDQLYAYTAAFILITGFLFRRYRPVILDRENAAGSWYIDWFHILVILILVPMAWAADSGWGCVYTLLMALYVLQYSVLEPWRKGAYTLAAVLAVLAFWQQPFIQWPDRIWLEVHLAPAALFTWGLSYIWKDEPVVSRLQNVLYGMCLAALVLDAFYTGNVADALMLEVVCLMVFLWAHVRKCTRWIRISGMVIVTVALYMTKDFWLSLSWWVYLLAAGLGLIIFAAVNEMKKP